MITLRIVKRTLKSSIPGFDIESQDNPRDYYQVSGVDEIASGSMNPPFLPYL